MKHVLVKWETEDTWDVYPVKRIADIAIGMELLRDPAITLQKFRDVVVDIVWQPGKPPAPARILAVDDAVPTLFPDAPKYFTKKAPVKRKDRNVCEQHGPAKKRQKPNSVSRQQPEVLVQQQELEDPSVPEVGTSDAVHAVAEVQHAGLNLRLPDETWNKLTFRGEHDSAVYGVCELEGEQVDHILLPKLVKFKANSCQQNSLCCFVYLRGKLHSQCTVSSQEEGQSVLDSTHALTLCRGCGIRPEKQGQYVIFAGNCFSAKCTYVCESGGSCIHCKYLRKLVQNQMSRKRRNGRVSKRRKKLANTSRILLTAQKKLLNAERELAAMRQANQQIADEVLGARIKSLPEKQQMAVKACFEAAARKSTSGMLYEKEWILECVLLRMRSPKLYEHLRKQKVLILPSRTCLQRYTRSFKSGFGFNSAVFNALATKTRDMDISSRHGGIIFDEIKLAEHFSVNAVGTVEGFVDLGKFTLDEDRTTPADHGMVMMFQPFQGDWTQILGVFSSKGNIKAEMLAKLLLEATLLSEQAGLFVDFVSCDGATWNRSMWRSFGIGASSGKTTCSATHPVDPSRRLHFCSDFPHLVKCVRNSFVSTGFTTQDGRVCVQHIEAAWEKDKSSLTLKAMPHITRAHIRPNSFEKMKVNLAFTIFSDEVLKGMFLLSSDIDEISRSKLVPTVEFVKRMSRLIAVMTSRCPRDGLRPSSDKVADIEAFLLFMDHWEAAANKAGGGFVNAAKMVKRLKHMMDKAGTPAEPVGVAPAPKVDIGDGVYVEEGLLMRLRLDANNSGSRFARGLLKALFTKEKLEGRSLFGRPSNAHKGLPQKVPLDSRKINAILGYTPRHFNVLPGQLKNTLSSLLARGY
ncbi:hypothetical protein HPB49_000096 [Dermacentor silvarum]|uniref:Uncharacterized protein n=1 Tax=Dermacentor silvarum TaxID=543639 RepID=A0ACB8C052_DERSI|nr:hypothetical protein HPB49_000096 [Dermacentor silvarum]